MRKSRWAAATGIGSLVLLLAACGGGSSSSTTAAGGGSAPAASSGSAPANSATSSTTTAATATSTATSPHVTATPHHTAGPQPSSGGGESIPPVGTTVMIVQHSALGYVLAEANGQVLYTYGKDKKGGVPTCTGSCAATWLPATGTPQASPADTFPGQFALIKTASGVEQITYNGYPLYLLKGARPYATAGNNMGGLWHVVPLSASDIKA